MRAPSHSPIRRGGVAAESLETAVIPADVAAMHLSTGDGTLEFVEVPLTFRERQSSNVFAAKNNKTLRETISHRRYVGLASSVHASYAPLLDAGLGAFLATLKERGDPFYRLFLNAYGDLAYCEFAMADGLFLKQKGLYCFSVAGAVRYIGRCTDSFWKRINQGYGRIHPKNCYRDGQSTNCHLNALIAAAAPDVCLYVHAMDDASAICVTEAALIRRYGPEWNVQLRRTEAADMRLDVARSLAEGRVHECSRSGR